NSPVGPNAHGAQPHVNVAKSHPEQAAPGPSHVFPIQATDAAVNLVPRRRPAELIEIAPDQMPQGMAPEGIAPQQRHIQRQHQGADADAERHCPRLLVLEPKRLPYVPSEKYEENEGEIKEKTMHVLQD